MIRILQETVTGRDATVGGTTKKIADGGGQDLALTHTVMLVRVHQGGIHMRDGAENMKTRKTPKERTVAKPRLVKIKTNSVLICPYMHQDLMKSEKWKSYVKGKSIKKGTGNKSLK